MEKKKIFLSITNNDIYKKLQCIDKRTIKIEKHAIRTNGHVEAHDKSIGLLWKFVIVLVVAGLGGGGYALLG